MHILPITLGGGSSSPKQVPLFFVSVSFPEKSEPASETSECCPEPQESGQSLEGPLLAYTFEQALVNLCSL